MMSTEKTLTGQVSVPFSPIPQSSFYFLVRVSFFSISLPSSLTTLYVSPLHNSNQTTRVKMAESIPGLSTSPESQQGYVVGSVVALAALALVSVCARIQSRVIGRVKLGADDILILFALVCSRTVLIINSQSEAWLTRNYPQHSRFALALPWTPHLVRQRSHARGLLEVNWGHVLMSNFSNQIWTWETPPPCVARRGAVFQSQSRTFGENGA